MIETINPSTDSLYKFLALVGLVLFLSSLTAPFWMYNKIGEQWMEVVRDGKILDAEAEEWRQAGREMDRAGTRFEKSWERLTDRIEKFKKQEISRAELDKAFEEHVKATRDIHDNTKNVRLKVAEWDKKHAQLQHKKDLTERNESNARVMTILAALGTLTGLIFSIVGFSLWYKRTQRYEDAVLRNKAENENKA